MELLTIKEVSKRLKICPSDAYKLINKGLIPYTVLGSKKVADFDLDNFIKNIVGKDLSNPDDIKEIKIIGGNNV